MWVTAAMTLWCSVCDVTESYPGHMPSSFCTGLNATSNSAESCQFIVSSSEQIIFSTVKIYIFLEIRFLSLHMALQTTLGRLNGFNFSTCFLSTWFVSAFSGLWVQVFLRLNPRSLHSLCTCASIHANAFISLHLWEKLRDKTPVQTLTLFGDCQAKV